jgi:hypothetical protein
MLHAWAMVDLLTADEKPPGIRQRQARLETSDGPNRLVT